MEMQKCWRCPTVAEKTKENFIYKVVNGETRVGSTCRECAKKDAKRRYHEKYKYHKQSIRRNSYSLQQLQNLLECKYRQIENIQKDIDKIEERIEELS